MPPQTIALDRTLAARAHLLVVRPFVHNRRVRVSNVRHIRRLNHDRDVALGGNHDTPDALRGEFIARHEGVLVGPDIVIIIRPVPDAAATIEARFRRQRRPADVILARSPRDPGRRPFVTRHPNPADASQPDPASIVIRGPAVWFVRHPGPACVGINPATIRVGSPTAGSLGFARLPDVTVVRRFPPRAVRFQLPVKRAVRIARASFGSLHRFTSFRSVPRRPRGRFSHRCFRHGRCCRRSRSFFFSHRFFARLEIGLLLGKTFCFVGLPLSREPLLHLTLDFGLLFGLRLRFLAGNKKCERCDDWENAKLFHCGIRP